MVSSEALARFVNNPSAQSTSPGKAAAFEMEEYLSKCNFEVIRQKPWQSRPGAVVYEIARCPFNADHTHGSAAFTEVDGVPGFTCKHSGCHSKNIRDVFAIFPPGRFEGVTSGSPTKPLSFSIDDIPSVWQCEASTKWLIDGLIAETAVTLLSGDSGIGKSTFVLALGGAVAHGLPFLGRESVQRSVLYVDRENPLAVVRERIERLGIAETPALKIWGLWVNPTPDGPTAANILQFARAHRPLIIFDSLVGFHPGSEQDASETRRHMQAYISLAAAGASVVVLHHTGKADTTKQYRGSSDIKAAVDVAWVLESLSEPDAGIRSLRLKAFKNRLTLPETVCIEYQDGLFVLSAQRAQTNREILERLIAEHPGASRGHMEKLAAAAGIPQKRTRALLDAAARDGWLSVERGPRGRLSYWPSSVEVGML